MSIYILFFASCLIRLGARQAQPRALILGAQRGVSTPAMPLDSGRTFRGEPNLRKGPEWAPSL